MEATIMVAICRMSIRKIRRTCHHSHLIIRLTGELAPFQKTAFILRVKNGFLSNNFDGSNAHMFKHLAIKIDAAKPCYGREVMNFSYRHI
jgi:hypothetical protein